MLKILFFIFLIPNAIYAQKSQAGLILPDLIPYKIGKLFGYCDRDMKVIIDAKFDQASPFSFARLTLKNKRASKFQTAEYATVK